MKLPGAYEYMATMAAPAINFGRGILGYQDPFLTQTMQNRMAEIEGERTQGNVGYDEYGLVPSAGRFTGGLFDLAINRPADFALAGSIGKYDFGPEGRKGLEYNFTPDQDTGSTGNVLLDYINRGGVKNTLANLNLTGTAHAAIPKAQQFKQQLMNKKKQKQADVFKKIKEKQLADEAAAKAKAAAAAAAKEAAQKAATKKQAAQNKKNKTGGYQSSHGGNKGFMGGKGTAAEMGSFAQGGLIDFYRYGGFI